MSVDPVSLGVTLALNAANMALTASQKIEGPRLDNLQVTTASYGTPMNYFKGTRRFDGVSCFWKEDLREVKRRRKTKGGKYNEYTYYGTWAVAICDHEIDAVTRIWFDRNLVYDATSGGPITPFGGLENITSYMRIYLGTADQEPDSRMSATIDALYGADSTPAYRGVAYIVFEDLPLEKLGNRLPQVSVEAVTAGGPEYPYDERDTTEKPFRLWGMTYSPDYSRVMWGTGNHYEIWDVASRSLMIEGDFDPGGQGAATTYGVNAAGTIYTIIPTPSSSFPPDEIYQYAADGVGAGTLLASLGSAWAESCQVLTAGNGFEYLALRPYGPISTLAYYDFTLHDLVVDANIGWTPSGWCVDSYGDIWVAGAVYSNSTPQTTLYIKRVIDTGVRPGSLGYAEITGMPGTVDFGKVHLYHYDDHFVVAWDFSSLHIIDDETLTLTSSRTIGLDVYMTAKQFAWVRPGASSIWLNNGGVGPAMEISSADLSTIRTLETNLWSGLSEDGFIYDPVNHALIATRQSGIYPNVRWLFLDRASGDGVTLRTIVEDVADRCGLVVADDIDATALDQTVQGYSWVQGSGKAILEPLLEVYDSEARPHDFTLQFQKRNQTSLATIPVTDMGAGGGVRYEIARTLDTDLPQVVNFTFADVAADQQENSVPAKRHGSAVDSARSLAIDLTTWATDVDDARQKAERHLRRQWYEAEKVGNALTRAYTKLEPGDVYTLTLDDISRACKLKVLEFGANGVLTCDWVRYAPAIATATALPGADGDGLVTPVIEAVGYTKGLVLDVPLAKDADEGLIVYLSAGPYSDDLPWPGATFYESADGVDYEDEFGSVASNETATWGYTDGVLADALPEVWDRASTLSVTIKSGELTSVTEAEAMAGANLFLIGDELVNVVTCTLTAPGVYTLSTMLRGRRGTEWATGDHAAGETVVLMSETVRQTMGASDLSVLAYYKAITNGGTAGLPQSLTYSGASLKPYSVAHLDVEESGGDLVATWVRRTRIGGAWRDYEDASLGEGSEAYIGQILNGSGAVIRTFSGLTSPTLTYTAAQQSTDSNAGVTLRVYQVSATVGNGFPADIAI